jgi:hypothetical protein
MMNSRSDKSFWRGCLIGGATLLFVGLLWQFVVQPPPAYGQVPDSGAQRNAMLREMATTNKKLTEIANLLKEIRDLEKADAGEKPDERQP